MPAAPIEDVGFQTILLVFASLLAVLVILFLLLWIGWKKEGVRGNKCPYCGRPMRLGIDVARSITEMVNGFLAEQPQPENPQIDFARAAYCPVTGRIFPECVSGTEQISLSWNFIRRRCEGTFVSWGALSEDEKGILKLLHGSLEGFQIEQSSSHLRPEEVEEDFSSLSPGPLYIDRKTKVVVGWKKVPGTYFEVLVVQQPRFQSLEETL
jgi:hypothetical protein